jgi:peptidoglycan hydrolase-like protein with peptidoglycan-binding domain
MPAAPLFALLALAGIGAAAAASSKHSGPPPTSGSFELDPQLPEALKAQVLSAIGTVVDPNALDALAAQLDAQGWHLSATALRQRAGELRAHPPPAASPPAALPAHHDHGGHHWPTPAPGAPPPTAQVPLPSAPPMPMPGPVYGAPPPGYGTPPIYVPPPAMPPPATGPQGLDPNIDAVTAQAVLVALATENDPAKLHGFAIAIQAQYPIAAHLLEQKRLVLLQSQAAAMPQPAPAPSRVSSETRDVQHGLNVLHTPGTPLVEDGINGPKTIAAVKAFQQSRGLKVDGIVGPQTRAALVAALAPKQPATAVPVSTPPPVVPPPTVVPIRPPPSAAAPSAPVAPSPSRGSSDLRDVQHGLNVLHTPGTPLVEDGLNGPKTIAAVKAFQQAHGLAVDGIVGPQTRAALTHALSGEAPAVVPLSALDGVHGVQTFAPVAPAPHAVPLVPVHLPSPAPAAAPKSATPAAAAKKMTLKDVQHALNVLHVPGTPLVEDGISGPKTIAAVKAFQQAHGLAVDGKPGPQTYGALTAALGATPVAHAANA